MEKVENCEADVSSRKRRHSSLEHSDSVPQSDTSYCEPQPIFVAKKISLEKSSFSYPPGQCTMWYEERLIGDKKVAKLYIAYLGKLLFSDRWLLTVKLITPQCADGQLQTFNIECPNKLHTFDINVPENDTFEMFLDDFFPSLNGDILTQTCYGHRFDNRNRPHDIVLNCSNNKLYCSKMMLAVFSNYFDRVLFSETADPNMTSHDLLDLKAETVIKLLNIGLIPYEKINVRSFNVSEIQALFFLDIWVLVRTLTHLSISYDGDLRCRYIGSEDVESCANIMVALELSEKPGLEVLLGECTSVFYTLFSNEQKESFFAKNNDRLRKLNWKTIIKFTTEGFGNKWLSTGDLNVVFRKEESALLKPQKIISSHKKLFDAILLIGGREFQVHKKYLAFWSPFFDRLFFGGFSEAGKLRIELKDIDPEEFGKLIRKIYAPRYYTINDSNVRFMLKLADRFEMKLLMIICGIYLDKKINDYQPSAINPPNIIVMPLMDLVELADTYNFIDAQNSFILKLGKMDKSVSNDFRVENYSRFEKLSRRLMKNIFLSL